MGDLLVVEDKILTEQKEQIWNIPKTFEFQVLSYLKASGIKFGLVVNFGDRRYQL